MNTSLKHDSIVFISGRLRSLCTEMIFDEIEIQGDVFYVNFSTTLESLGYAEFTRVNGKTFQLSRLLPENVITPSPIVAMSGVLWRRQAAIEAEKSIRSYLREL